MLDLAFIHQNPEKIKKSTQEKGVDPKLVDQLLEVDKKRRELINQVEKLKQERNQLHQNLKEKPGTNVIEKGRQLREKVNKLEPELKKLKEKFQSIMFQIPNPPADDVKAGKDESENEAIRKWGEPTKFDFKPKDHLEIGEKLNLIDVKRAAKVSGSRFAYLKSDLVLLEFALVQLALKTLIKEGFIPIIPPVIIKKEAMRGMGYLEHGGEEDMYVLDKDNLVLVGTSEQTVGPMHKDEVLDSKKLPLRYLAFSTCFRRESGTYGKDTRGILRVHQFNKVEMFSFTKPEDSDKELEHLLSLEEKLFQALEIPYQVVKMCSGDLGAPAAKKYDLEAWLPGQNKYREVTSASTTTDFQARRLNIKYNDGQETNYVHMLNGTAVAMGRTIIAILENYQQKDGSVKIPKILQEYVGKEVIGQSSP